MRYLNFYKKSGVRSYTDVQHPTTLATQDFLLPVDAVTHYIEFNDVSVGPSNDSVIIKNNVPNGLYLQDIYSLSSLVGNPKDRTSVVKPLILNHYRSLEGIHKLTSAISSISLSKPILLNYSPINLAYVYKKSSINKVYQWSNLIKTVMTQVAEEPSRQHVLYIQAPLADYKDSWYDKYNKLSDKRLADVLPGPYVYFALQINKWLTGKSSLFDAYDTDTLKRTSIAWHVQGRLLLVSFEVLLAFNNKKIDDSELLNAIPKALSKSIRADVVSLLIHQLYASTVLQVLEPSEEADSADETELYDQELSVEEVEEGIVKETSTLPDTTNDPVQRSQEKLDSLADVSDMKAAKYKTLTKKIEVAKELPSPYDPTVKVTEYIKTTPGEAALSPDKNIVPENIGIPDASMRHSSLVEYDKIYINTLNKKHIARSVQAIQSAGIIVTDHKIETNSSILGATETHIVKTQPIDGAPSTIRFTLPVVNEDGTYMSNGTTYRLKKQRIDLPIRKINPAEVALGTDYGKLFVRRSKLAIDDEGLWLKKLLLKRTFDPTDKLEAVQGGSFDHLDKVPLMYSKLNQHFRSIKLGSIRIHLEKSSRVTLLRGKDEISTVETKDRLLVGRLAKGYILMDTGSLLWKKEGSKKAELLGNIYDLLDIDQSKSAKDLATIAVFGRKMSIAIPLGYYLGLNKLFSVLGVKIKTFAPRKRLPTDMLMRIVFSNVTIAVMEASAEARMILQGLSKMIKITKDIPYDDFSKRHGDGYLLLLEDGKTQPSRYIREFDLLEDMYIDPISKEVLADIKEPTVLLPLLLRAVELLKTDDHPITTDGNYIRTRGYERLSGSVYKEMVLSIRGYRARPDGRRKVIEMPPYAVWADILQDNTNKPTEEMNPIGSLKESEIVTYTGQGGRSRETMTASSRRFSESDTGILSEATPDSGDTGINAYMSPNPQLGNVYGVSTGPLDNPVVNQASSYSTSYLLSPGAARDAPSRINFISIQNSHLVSMKGAAAPIVRTGYEYVLPYRTNSLYSHMADEDGKVINVDDQGIIVKYKSGKEVGVKLGRQYGTSEGAIYPHPIITNLSKGKSFKQGAVIAYNSGFFEIDRLVPGKLIFKQGRSINVALTEGMVTYEDSCAVSSRMVEPLSTQTVKATSYLLSFEDNVHNMIAIGTTVNIGDPLFIIEDAISANTDIFDEDSVDTLSELASQSPKAKYKGVVDKIEIKYHGEITDMSSGIAKLTRAANRRLSAEGKSVGIPAFSGQVTSEYRVQGKPLQMDALEIKIFILRDHAISGGDKFVFASQLKATISKIYTDKMMTTDGREIDGLFSYRAMAARQVHSAIDVGIYSTVLIGVGKKLAAEYKP